MLSNGQRTERVVFSSDRDVDGQLGTVKEPQARFFHIGGILEVSVQLLGNGIRDLVPRLDRVDVSRDLAVGSTRDTGFQGRRLFPPRNGIDDDIVGDIIVHAAVVQVRVLGDLLEIGEAGVLEVVRGKVENRGNVRDLADSENTTKAHVRSPVGLERVDEQGPVEPGIWLSEDPGDEAIG